MVLVRLGLTLYTFYYLAIIDINDYPTTRSFDSTTLDHNPLGNRFIFSALDLFNVQLSLLFVY